MSEVIDGLAADVGTLTTVIPALAQGFSDLHTGLAQKETSLNEEIAKEGVDQETITKLQGELAQVEQIKAQLDPLVPQLQSLVPGNPTTTPAIPPAEETPVVQPTDPTQVTQPLTPVADSAGPDVPDSAPVDPAVPPVGDSTPSA